MAGRRILSSHRGAALLIFLVLLVMAGLAYVVNALTPRVGEAERKTREALALAREALIHYAATFRDEQNRIQIKAGNPPPNDLYGYLPLPDLGTSENTNIGCPWEGCDANLSGSALNKTVVGRFPWRLLGTGPLRDGQGECLWYAVSGSHQRIEKATPMNWDTLGQIDIVAANGTDALKILSANPHDRPLALIFSPGPILPGQKRSASAQDDVTLCGGNYDPKNYLDPNLATILDSAGNATSGSVYFSGAVTTDTGSTRIAFALHGPIHRQGTTLQSACSDSAGECIQLGNDLGLVLTPDSMFAAIRKNAYFRQDINALLDRIVSCLRDENAAQTDLAKISAPDDNGCFGKDIPPIHYYPHYKELIFVKRGTVKVNGVTCQGAVLFASQRGPGQRRATPAEKADFANYLEGVNLAGNEFSGADFFDAVSPHQSVFQDIVRCVPGTPSFVTVGPDIPGVGSLARYDSVKRILTLGQPVASGLPNNTAPRLFGCAWTPETHPMGGGLRSYFLFRINDASFSGAPTEGITFAIIDGDRNGVTACGAAGQHLGYSGDNGITPFIAPPKIGFEIDPRRQAEFNPNAANHLFNGRNDPLITGGHVAFVYWGGEIPIQVSSQNCQPPRVRIGGDCYLPPSEDDNVHGQTASPRAGFPTPPANPPASAAYKLDPNLSQVPVNRDFHVRIELTRIPADYSLPRVRLATTGPLDLSAPDGAVDGVALFPGDRVLVKDQVDATQNGVYVWEGPDKAMTRSSDAAGVTALAGLIVEVQQGATQARTLWRQQTTQPGPCAESLNCTPIVWKPLEIAQFSDLPAAASAPRRVVYVQQGDQGNGWFRSDGSNWQRLSVSLSTQEAITVTNPPATIDGIAPVAGSRILVRHQTRAAENGVYVWNGAGIPMSRAADFDTAAELAGAIVQVLSGSDAGRAFRQTAMPHGGILETDAVRWEAIDPPPRYALQVWILPDSSADAHRIAAMKDTTRPMSLLSPDFAPQLSEMPVIPYPFRNVRLGFTVGQRARVTDQNFSIRDFSTTWIP